MLSATLGNSETVMTAGVETNVEQSANAVNRTLGNSESGIAAGISATGSEQTAEGINRTLASDENGITAGLGARNCGLSAYEIWLQAGNSGTEEDFLASLVGPPGSGVGEAYEIGTGLKVEDNVLSVDSATDFNGDNTRPVEAAFMQEQIGNIELLLKTI